MKNYAALAALLRACLFLARAGDLDRRDRRRAHCGGGSSGDGVRARSAV